MLMLSTLHTLLSQVLSLPELHTAILLTPAGQLVSYASDPSRSKDDVRIVVGLSGELWQETQEQGYGMVDSELGRILVLAIDEPLDDPPKPLPDGHQPLMLLALNANSSVEWEELQLKGKALVCHLAKPLSKFREHLLVPKPSPISSISSPTLAR